jgi:hypothetical protein
VAEQRVAAADAGSGDEIGYALGLGNGRPVNAARTERYGAVYRWIDDQMKGKSCIVVLIGGATVNRKYINYEIGQGWAKGKGLMGVDIHRLKNLAGEISAQGANPFDFVNAGGYSLSSRVVRYTAPSTDSRLVYGYIRDNLAAWVDTAVAQAAKR